MDTNEILSATATLGRSHYHTELTARRHVLIGDEPVEIGGTDDGPRPGDFIRMGLASCTAITLRMYADRKQWNVERIVVKVSNGPFADKTRYQTDIEIAGQLSQEQKERLMQIAQKCPVHKTLINPIEIETSLTVKS